MPKQTSSAMGASILSYLADGASWLKRRWYQLAIGAFLLFYCLQTGFYLSIQDYVHGPDEGYHVDSIMFYAEHPLSPFSVSREEITDLNCNAFDARQTVVTDVILYHWIVGLLVMVAQTVFSPDLALQIGTVIQSVFGLGTVVLVLMIARRLTQNRIAHILSLSIVTGLTMFVYLGSVLNYDNLAILAATASIYFFIRFAQKDHVSDLLWLMTSIAVGVATKFTILPLALAVVVASIVLIGYRVFRTKTNYLVQLPSTSKLLIGATVFCVGLSSFFFVRNIIFFGSPTPSTPVVKQCEEGQPGKRDERTITPDEELVSLPTHLVTWSQMMFDRSISIVSHKSLVKSPVEMQLFALFVVIGFLLYLGTVRKTKIELTVLGIVLFYTAVLYVVNYRGYVSHGAIGVGVQGRYLFPVMAVVIVAVARGWVQLVPAVASLYSRLPKSYRFLNKADFVGLSRILVAVIVSFFLYTNMVPVLANYNQWRARDYFRINSTELRIVPLEARARSPQQVVTLLEDPAMVGSEYQGPLLEEYLFQQQETIDIEAYPSDLMVYLSTYDQPGITRIGIEFFDATCSQSVGKADINNLRDNAFATVPIPEELIGEPTFCFRVLNDSDQRIALWYAGSDIPGCIWQEKACTERDFIYSFSID